MNIRAHIELGDHVINPEKLPTEAFGETLLNAGTDPSISVSESFVEFGVPPQIAAVTKFYTLRDKFRGATRDVGEYIYKGAKAKVSRDGNPSTWEHTIDVEGVDIKEVYELHRLIRAGLIPSTLSYDKPQVESYTQSVFEAARNLIEALARWLDRKKI